MDRTHPSATPSSSPLIDSSIRERDAANDLEGGPFVDEGTDAGPEGRPGERPEERPEEEAPGAAADSPGSNETRLPQRLSEFIVERPFLAIGGAIAAGFLIGRLLSR